MWLFLLLTEEKKIDQINRQKEIASRQMTNTRSPKINEVIKINDYLVCEWVSFQFKRRFFFFSSFEWRERESERAKLDTHWLNFDFSFLYFSFLNWLDTVVRQLASYSSSPSQSLFGDKRAKTTKKQKKNCRIAFVVIISIYALRLLFCLCHISQ